jgi:hypothetical protein
VNDVKIGSYSIPDLRLFPTIYNDAKLIYDNYRLDEAKDDDTVAKLLKHKRASGGTWFSKIADMRLYGVLEPRGIKLTPLTEQMLYGTEEEKQEATKKIILNVPFWGELFSRFGKELPESNFWVQIQKITGIDPLEARNSADYVRKAYLDDISHIKLETEEKNLDNQNKPDTIDKNEATINIRAGQFSQTIPMTEDGIELAKGFLDLLGKQIKNKKKEQNTEENS